MDMDDACYCTSQQGEFLLYKSSKGFILMYIFCGMDGWVGVGGEIRQQQYCY